MYELKQLSDMNVANFSASYKRFMDKLVHDGFKIKNVMPINNNRYCIIFGEEKTIMFMYKKEVFFNFGSMFRSKGYTGVGDSINKIDLQKALISGVEEIYTCFQNGIVYKIKLIDFLTKCVSWVNKEGKEVRSISIHNYQRAFAI